MKIVKLEFTPVSIPYTRPEVSSKVSREGVSDIVVKVVTDTGLVGWGESCSGANLESVLEALGAMEPFVVGRSPWEAEAIRHELWHQGNWLFRRSTASFAWAGIDMALWDICGKDSSQPLYNLFGGKLHDQTSYFYYLAQGPQASLTAQCVEGLAREYEVFYMKVGIDIDREYEMVRTVRETLGPTPRIRLDANGVWTVNEAIRNLARLDEFDIDWIEQPVSQDPVANMQEVRRRTPVGLCANEGMWSTDDAYRQITSRTADVYCFSSYWVGSLIEFQRLCYVAAREGLQVCKHTHGEFGLAAVAAHHILLTLPNIVEGHQQTAQIMKDDLLAEPLPITNGPKWGVPEGPGLGIDVDLDKLHKYHNVYQKVGQFLPYERTMVGQFNRGGGFAERHSGDGRCNRQSP